MVEAASFITIWFFKEYGENTLYLCLKQEIYIRMQSENYVQRQHHSGGKSYSMYISSRYYIFSSLFSERGNSLFQWGRVYILCQCTNSHLYLEKLHLFNTPFIIPGPVISTLHIITTPHEFK